MSIPKTPIKAMPPHAQHAIVVNLANQFRICEGRLTAGDLFYEEYTMADIEELCALGWIVRDGLAFIPGREVEWELNPAKQEVA